MSSQLATASTYRAVRLAVGVAVGEVVASLRLLNLLQGRLL